jgi:2-(1,2-epoxy-1,2-dihydrophenyl)acetyl-CoA isomerase
VNRVVPADELEKTARAWAARLAAQSASALALIKLCIDSAIETSFSNALEDEATPEAAEALRAFFDES